MKKSTKIISLILVLSLLFSSMIFTTGAATDDILDTQFSPPLTAEHTPITSSNYTTAFNSIKASYANSKTGSPYAQYIFGGNDLSSYLVSYTLDGSDHNYVMLVPTDKAASTGTTANHSYFQANVSHTTSYGQNQYYVFDIDVATESAYLPLNFMINTRYDTDGDGNTNPIAGTSFTSNDCLAMTSMVPGVFYHLTIIAHPDSNTSYIYLNDNLIETVANSVMTTAQYANYKTNANMAISLTGVRVERSKTFANASICVDNISDRVFTANTSDATDISNFVGKSSLAGWKYNVSSQSAMGDKLPDLIEINGVRYNNTVDASHILHTFRLGTKAVVLRSSYAGSITVNCDAEINVPVGAEIDLAAGDDVNLIKGGGSLWIATLKNFKHSATVVSTNVTTITSSVRYSAADNLISSIEQNSAVNARSFNESEFNNLVSLLGLTEAEKALFIKKTENDKTVYELTADNIRAGGNSFINKFKEKSVNGLITSTDNGNEYLIVRDATNTAGDFPLNVHYQVNANVPLQLNGGVYVNYDPYTLGAHSFVVFEQDIYSESSFINIYNQFNVRATVNKPLSSIPVFASNVSVTPESWYHLTYIGEISSGDSYLFLNGKCIARVVGGLYDNGALKTVSSLTGIDINDKQALLNNMVLGSFRTMQIAGENLSGQGLTPDMSAASDNYYLRWADNDDSMTEFIQQIDADYNNIPEGSQTPDKTIDGDYYITSWKDNVFNESYILPERAVIATINGVEYYDTTSINDMLDDVDNPENNEDYAEHTTPLQEIVLYREYIGTINVGCRATVKLNGIQSQIEYADGVTVVYGTPITVYKQTDAAIACVDGTLYYDAESLNNVLNKEHKEQYTVTFLSVPDQSITVIANALIDFNGLTLTNVTLGNSDCIVAEGTQLSTVINLKDTTVVATMNGTDYYDDEIAELQADVNSQSSIEISFYSIPSTPIKIACPANVATNGLVKNEVTAVQIFTTDLSSFVIRESTESGFDYTIEKCTSTSTIEINYKKNGSVVATRKVDAPLGSDIASVLTQNGYMSGVLINSDNGQTATTLDVVSWVETPAGTVTKKNGAGGESAYVFTANITHSWEVSGKYAYIASGYVTPNWKDTVADVMSWLGNSSTATIVLFDDITLTQTVAIKGSKSIYLNSHSINNTTLNEHHMKVDNSAKDVYFFGEGTINYVTNGATKGVLYTDYDYKYKTVMNNVTVNSTSYVVQARSGSFEFNGCTINVFVNVAEKAFYLGEDYNGNYSKTPMRLSLIDCNISYQRNADTVRNALIDSKTIVSAADPERIITIDGCNIVSQGALLRIENNSDRSNTKVYINNSGLVVKAIAAETIKSGSVLFCDDVRINFTDKKDITFANDLVCAKTSDGIYKAFYTSHAYTPITWSNGVSEYWATGSTPNSYDCRFDSVTPGIGDGQTATSYTSTGNSFPFGLIANLTLSDMIGFNVYVPVKLKNGTAVNHEDVQVYLDGRRIEPNKFADSNTVRTTVVAAASGYGDGYCYDYTLALAPKDAAKEFTIVIIYGGRTVSRTVSVADYANSLYYKDKTLTAKNPNLNEKNKALLQVTLDYIYQAVVYSNTPIDMTKINKLRGDLNAELGTRDVTPTEPTLPTGTTEADSANLGTSGDGALGYIKSVQINLKDNSAFRFRLTNASYTDDLLFYVANDRNDGYEKREAKVITVGGATYLELSLRAYEMSRSVKIVLDENGNGTADEGEKYDLYSLYTYYNSIYAMAYPATTTDSVYEYRAVLKVVKSLYTYASVCDKYLDKNAAEYENGTGN